MFRVLPPRYSAEFILAMIAMFLFGALDMIRGVVAPTLIHRFGLDFTSLGILLSASSSGYFISSLISGFMVDHWGMKATLLFGNALLLVGVGGTLGSFGFVTLVLSFLLSGLGNGMMEIGTNSIVPRAAEAEQSKFFNILHATYGVGATTSPLIAGYSMVVWNSWKLPYLGVGILLIALLIGTFLLRYPEKLQRSMQATESEHGHSMAALPAIGPVETPELELGKQSPLSGAETTVKELMRRVSLHALLIGITLYVIAEVGVSNWLPTLLHVTRHMNIEVGAAYLTGFYLLYTVGRFIGSVTVHRLGSVKAVVLSATLAFVSICVGLFGASEWVWMFAIAGLFFGIIFPTISSIAAENYPLRTGTVLGFLFAGAGLGSTIGSWVIGRTSDLFGLSAGFSTVLVGLAITALATLIFPYIRHREQRESHRVSRGL